MRNLLSANFYRLKKSVLFWGLLALSFAFGAFTVYTQISDRMQYGIAVQLNSILFFYAMAAGLLSAVFVSLFLGTEYSDGAIRNKIAAGLSRWKIYLANLLTGMLVSFLSCGVTLLTVLGLGLPTIGGLTLSAPLLVRNVLGSMVMAAAFCAIYTAITMNCAQKAAAAVSCILLFFALMTGSAYVQARLEAPEYNPSYSLSLNGVLEEQMELNQRYLRGTEREVYQFIYDLLPTGQASQYTMISMLHPVRLVLCSLGIFFVTTGIGGILFHKKDLK